MWLALNMHHRSGHLCCKGIFMVGLKHKKLQTDHLLCGIAYIMQLHTIDRHYKYKSTDNYYSQHIFTHAVSQCSYQVVLHEIWFFCDTCQKLVAKTRHLFLVLLQYLSTVFLSQTIMIDPSCFACATSCFLIMAAMNAETSFDRSCFLDMLLCCLSLMWGAKQIDLLLKYRPNH